MGNRRFFFVAGGFLVLGLVGCGGAWVVGGFMGLHFTIR